MQALAIAVSLAVTLVAIALLVQAVARMVAVVRLGQPAPGRFGDYGARVRTLVTEVLGHTRMLKWRPVGIAHWFVMVGFITLVGALVEAYGELFDESFDLWLIGSWVVYDVYVELLWGLTLVGILALMGYRLASHPRRAGRKSRFTGSTMWQGYYVEWTILLVALAALALRGLEGVMEDASGYGARHLVSYPLVRAFHGLSPEQLRDGQLIAATLKIVVSMAWAITIATHLTMGVAWHRFTAFPNIFFKRNPTRATRPAGDAGADAGPGPGSTGATPAASTSTAGSSSAAAAPASSVASVGTGMHPAGEAASGVALGPLLPMMSRGKPVDFEDPGEDDIFGVGQVENFTWKGLLDFTTCTECGRCQSQCPAWNTAKPLSPKLLITGLRDHAYAKAPYLLAGGGKDAAGDEKLPQPAYDALPDDLRAEAERPLVGTAEENGVIDPDVLWSCTTCGACVEQCPVDIEHVDHIVDMRRYQVLIESAFPSELGGLFRNLENKGNPWGLNANDRLDWTSALDFDVPVVGDSVEDLTEVEYLFWVGCAGAFEDRAKRTTQAVAELLHLAGVRYAVLGPGETCNGDPARRAGNEFLFQMLAQQNIATLNEAKATTVVVTCPHCFNTLGREYPQVQVEGETGDYTVVHHTQLLNRLVREGRLTPVTPVEEKITYHDPCYLGRHNQVYSPPREILGAVPGLKVEEMPRNQQRSFCCGAGGARMWMEERIGKRINLDRVDEALSVQPDAVAVGCPFCKVMISDGVTARTNEGAAPASTEVLDVAQMLLRSVKSAPQGRDPATAEGIADEIDERSAGSEAGHER